MTAREAITILLLGLAFLAAYSGMVLSRPLHKCPACHGRRVSRSRSSRRVSACKRCAGTGRTRRIGATTIHRTYWSVLGGTRHEQRQAQHKQAQQKTEHPQP